MTDHLAAKLRLLLSFLAILTLMASCSGKQISATVGEESMTEGPSAEAEVAEPAPEPSAEPEPSLEGTSMEEAEPGPMRETSAGMEHPMLEAEAEPPVEEGYMGEPEPMREGPEAMEELTPEPGLEQPAMALPGEVPMEEVVPEPEPGSMPLPPIGGRIDDYLAEETPMGGMPPQAAPMEEEMVAAVEPEPMFADEMESVPSLELQPTSAIRSLDDIYFDFDRFSIRGDASITLEANARRLREREDLTILIEGHCDERGTIAYNLVLGERRAETAKRYLIDLGIPKHRIRIVSYGKERPVCSEYEEGCWQLNRRAHFVYGGSGLDQITG